MTRRAAVFALVNATALVVALSTGAQIYYLIVLAMASMLALSLISVLLALGTVKTSIRCPRRTAERGGTVPVVATVRHMGLLPVRSIALKLSLPDDAGSLTALEMGALPFETRRYEVSVACPHRGMHLIGVTRASVTDVFNLFTFSKRISGSQFQVEVLPRVTELKPLALRSGDLGDRGLSRMTEDAASPADVRQWLPGDALKKVHWKLSMRKRELMVRTYEESARPDTLVLIDLYPLSSLKSHALTVEDASCEAAVSLIKAQLTAGYPVRMPLMSAQPTELAAEDASGFGRFVQALTRVRFDSPFPFEQVMLLEMRRMQRTGGAVLVTPRLNARIVGLAMQMARGGMKVFVCWLSDSRREEALSMLTRLNDMGVKAIRIDPWGEGLTPELMTQRVEYGT